jgi:ribonuclease Z
MKTPHRIRPWVGTPALVILLFVMIVAVGSPAPAGAATDLTSMSVRSAGGYLQTFRPGEPVAKNAMRISFMGTSPIPRIAQQCNSVFVELGNGESFVFDYGSGVSSKYTAMGIPFSRQTRVFLTHLHGDHVSDLVTLYCFGPANDRKTPLHVYGPSGDTPEDGTAYFVQNLYDALHWHREAFSFLPTGTKTQGDGYDLIAHELPYMLEGGVAYENAEVKITHFPAIHDRDGSISYKLEWKTQGLSMIFSGDTKPSQYMVEQGKGVDVLIHEMVVSPEVWASKNSGLHEGDPGWERALNIAQMVENNSHTPEQALGYLLAQTKPRLGVATHFQTNLDTLPQAFKAVRSWYKGAFSIAIDQLVIDVTATRIVKRFANVSDFAWYPVGILVPPDQLAPAKYDGPYAQFNEDLMSHRILPEVYEK